MNSLTALISREKLDEVAVMNALHGEVGLISDLCVTASDVASKDCFRACQWVLANKERFNSGLGGRVNLPA